MTYLVVVVIWLNGGVSFSVTPFATPEACQSAPAPAPPAGSGNAAAFCVPRQGFN